MKDDPRITGVLVVGAGFLGAQRAAAVAASRMTRLVAVHDINPLQAHLVAHRFGAEAGFEEDFAQALGRQDVDAVIVATPHADHFPQVRAALEAGKHVLCEKPLAILPEHARRLAILADELRLRLATGFNHRFYPPVRDALNLAEAGSIGRAESVRAEIGHRASSEFLQSWHTDVAKSGGGTLMDNGPHVCDLVRQFLGEIVAAKGYVRPGAPTGLPTDCESEAFALFRDFDQGFAEVRSSWMQPTGYLTMEIRGSSGWLRLETAPWCLTGQLASGQRLARGYVADRVAERLFRARFGCERSLVQEIEAFVASPAGSTLSRREATGWDGCRTTEMIDAVYRASHSGQEVHLEPPLVHLPSSARRRAVEARSQ
jgi:predicted dehydrogenase